MPGERPGSAEGGAPAGKSGAVAREGRRHYRLFALAAVMVFFVAVGAVTAVLRRSVLYLVLFAAIGALAAGSIAIQTKRASPARRRAVRIATMWFFALLFGTLMAYKSINFQFPQIIFDFASGVVSGALIQMIVARLLAPLVFGNAFCSRACWNGAVFELLHRARKRKPRRAAYVRYAYLLALVLLTVILLRTGFDTNASPDVRRAWILSENGFIFVVGIGLSPLLGGRAYCKYLCPFLTVSRLLAPLSLLKVAGRADGCTGCGACEVQCPMDVPILSYVKKGKRVGARDCILCGRCVESCPQKVLEFSFRRRPE